MESFHLAILLFLTSLLLQCNFSESQRRQHYPRARACTSYEFKCRNGECISDNKRCDGIRDCRDGTDEYNCPPRCREDQFMCANGDCIRHYERCNGHYECNDRSDEENCNVTTCSGDQFRCNDGTCLNIAKHCDGTPDCRNGEDETQCECGPGQRACNNGVCINEKFFCDKNDDCHDKSDELNCPVECDEDQFTCDDGTCIPSSAVCNNKYECQRGEDERDCPPECSHDQFRCRTGECIRNDQRCDGFSDCPDYSDEENCPPRATDPPWVEPVGPGRHPMPGMCPAGKFTCVLDRQCVPISALCNSIPECTDGSDEQNCADVPRGLSLKTYPSDQIIKESREVVFQCRDEGPARAPVHWIRANGLPLPPGSRDINGRLEIPNIQIEHSGIYICEAVGYPSYTGGREQRVQLTVEKFEVPPTRPSHACKYDEATCSNGECIPKSFVCDGKFQCSDGSDEMRCGTHGCEPNQFQCASKECVSKAWRCDGETDCTDRSDEENCPQASPHSQCLSTEFQCKDRQNCIPRSFQCDAHSDCFDQSDEIGCSAVYIVKPPPPMVILDIGEVFEITCVAIGVPTPEISWRRNWGHVPQKCEAESQNGTGTLRCMDIQIEDQGAYSCEGINSAGFVLATPDTILVVNPADEVCEKGKFNSEATRPEDCIPCFCFGVATECHSADLFTYQIPPPFDRHKIINAVVRPYVIIEDETPVHAINAIPVGREGLLFSQSFDASRARNASTAPYYAMPESYLGPQLKSYGGYLKFNVHYNGTESYDNSPLVILKGNGYVLTHKGPRILPGQKNELSVRFFQREWLRQQDGYEIPATREEIMMTLANVENILIKAKYDRDPQLDVHLYNIVMDTADRKNTGLGSASFVEECRCPTGYIGLSCEECADGYVRRETGSWLGQCYKDEPPCAPGYYGDPSRNIECRACPCPLTNPSNQFSRTCYLATNGEPVCDNCPPGYEGTRCERCAAGYEGNPHLPGGMCKLKQQCDPDGSLLSYADPFTGQCRCKQYATGLTCNQCKANTFNLATKNQFGCISCFCMGITSKCVSSNWYRNEIRVSFTNSVRDFSLIEAKDPDANPIIEGINLDTVNREITYTRFLNRANNEVYYWQLPSIFLGDQITSYGGFLKYTVRYVPSPGGQSSKNSAADVELISSNDINLLYYARGTPEPNIQQSVTVPLLEQYWQRTDGTQADREHLLMALADIRAIRIKATYTTHTDEAALSFVSLDTAEKYNTGRPRAAEVEECSCPAGYRGLSCEDCDVGYTRAIEGLYLGICEPCNCNGHSGQCNPETGICENCADHTTGESCELCEPGYVGDATRGTPDDCIRNGTVSSCYCNPAGSVSEYCYEGRCECKRNVQGPECNRCRPHTFGLSASNIDGCIECFCSGISSVCHESSLYIQQIPILVYDSRHGFTLTDSTRREVIDDGFELNLSRNEIGYRYTNDHSRRLFWSLPPVFTGNKVKSYGGNLTLTQHFTSRSHAPYKDQDVLLIGNGITLFWSNPRTIEPEIPLTYSVPIRESEWSRLTLEGPKGASRSDLMTVLANLEAILVRASHSQAMVATYISDITMDTAVEISTGNGRATQVEACLCPTGYVGSSCESCAQGYYRDHNDRSTSVFGSCQQCPCNSNEQSCEVSRSGQVKCNCLPGYTGQYCESVEGYNPSTTTPATAPPKIFVSIREPEFQIVETGNTVMYHCMGSSEEGERLRIRWEKEGGVLPSDRSIDDSQGLLVIHDVRYSDSGVYVCHVSDGIHVEYKKITLSVGNRHQSEKPMVRIVPQYLDVRENERVEFRCEAQGTPAPTLEWIRVGGYPNPEARFDDGVWRIPVASRNDSGTYKCVARNTAGVTEQLTQLYVRENPDRPGPSYRVNVTISPPEYTGFAGDPMRLECQAQRALQVVWSMSGAHLPAHVIQQDGLLTIRNPTVSDSGIYVCTARSHNSLEISKSVSVTIISRESYAVRVSPERQTVPQGTLAEVRCITSGDPSLRIQWARHDNLPLGANTQQIGDTLKILNPQISDRGVYICLVVDTRDPSRTYEASAVIEVEPREKPVLELYPKKFQIVLLGGSTDLQCRLTAGMPEPEIHWSRGDNRPLPSNIVSLPGGVLRFTNVTNYDAGNYVCSASNEAGSFSIAATIEVQSIPVISITPAGDTLVVRSGENVKLVCRASGYPQPTVSWRKESQGLSLNGPQPQAVETPQSAVLEILSVTPEDEGTYTCQATNSAGIVDKQTHIQIDDYEGEEREPQPCRGDMCPPDYDPTPSSNSEIPDGGRVEMSCRISEPARGHVYLDWKRGDGRPLPPGTTIKNGTLIIPLVTKEAAGEYICFGVRRSDGESVFRTKSYLKVITLPRIELNPTRQTVRPGESPSIICTATGDPPIEIEWEAVGRPLPHTVTHNNGILQFHGITFSDAGKYACKARNRLGTAEAVAEVVVNVHSQDVPVRALEREVVAHPDASITLRCEARGTTAIDWSREGLPLPVNARQRHNYLQLTRVRPEDSGRYICQIRNANGVAEDYVNLHVPHVSAPVVTVDATPDPVNIGDRVDIRCLASGVRDPQYYWSQPHNRGLPSNSQVYENVLSLTNVGVNDSGVYRCTVNSVEGTLHEDYNLIVQGGTNDAPAIETKHAPFGSDINLDCPTDAQSPTHYQWRKLDNYLKNSAERTAKTRTLLLTNVTAEDAGIYVCAASNNQGTFEVPVVLVVTGIVPYFNQAPESYIGLSPLTDVYLKFNIEISFKPENYDGVLLYSVEKRKDSKSGDFIALALVGGYPQFSFDLGSGPAIIRADKPITLSQWHTIKLQRHHREGSMLIDGEHMYKGTAGGKKLGLDLVDRLYIGGIPKYQYMHPHLDVQQGFVGCISRLVVHGREIELVGDHDYETRGITTCETCAENECKNGGVCQEASTKQGYRCLCLAGFTGELCNATGESCYPGICGEGRCVNKGNGFECYCPYGKAGARCEEDLALRSPAFHHDNSYLGYQSPKAARRRRRGHARLRKHIHTRDFPSYLHKDKARSYPTHLNALPHSKKD